MRGTTEAARRRASAPRSSHARATPRPRSTAARPTRVIDIRTPAHMAHPAATSRVKRAADVVLAAVLLVLLSPVFVVVALAIVATSRGPVVFRQDRAGWHGIPFSMLKFRTMVDGADRRMPSARAIQRGRRPAVQDPRRPSGHAGRSGAAAPLARRAAAAVERAPRRHVPRRAATHCRCTPTTSWAPPAAGSMSAPG